VINIKEIPKRGLCMGCGTCVAACQSLAIEIIKNEIKGIYVPQIDESLCTLCGLCLEICPGYSVDYEQLNQKIFGKQPNNIWLGNYINTYIGHAKEYQLRYSASSGGLITALLTYALRKKIIDGVLLTRMDHFQPCEPEIVIAETDRDIISAMGSKMCPVPANVGLRDIAGKLGNFAFVGLPCHIHGLRKLEIYRQDIKKKIIFRFGLMCSKTPTFLGTEYFLKKKGIKKEDVKKISYRGKGWLGYITVLLKNGAEKEFSRVPTKFFDKFNYLSSFHYDFCHPRCLLCCDHNCEFSDVSFGDPRLPELLKKEKMGKSLVVTRTQVGEDIIQQAFADDEIDIAPIDNGRFFNAQSHSFQEGFKVHLNVFKLMRRPIPIYKTPKLLKNPKLSQYIRILRYLPSNFSTNRLMRSFFHTVNLIVYVINKKQLIKLIKQLINTPLSFSSEIKGRFRNIVFYRIYPRLLGKQDWSEISVYCIVSTGRAGTKFIANFLDEFSTDIVAKHEPSPKLIHLANTFAAGKISQQRAIKRLEFARRQICRSINKRKGKIYIESNPHLFSLIPVASKVFKKIKFIHIIRDGRDVVRSGMSRWWYKENDITPRIKALDFAADEYYDKWNKMTRFEKVCWFWQKRISIISNDIKDIPNVITVKFDDIFNKDKNYPGIKTIFDFIGIELDDDQYLDKIERRANVTQEYAIPPWQSWSEEMKKKFDEIAGIQMSNYYSNYKK